MGATATSIDSAARRSPNARGDARRPIEPVTTQPTPATDRELVVAVQHGDFDAYSDIYARHVARVRNVCRGVLSNDHDVQEAVQETFLKAFQALGRFNGQYALGAWLGRIAFNACLDHVRVDRRRPQLVPLAWEHESLVTESPPEEVVIGTHPRLDEVLDGLLPLHAEALKLRAIGGYSHEEMAGQLQISSTQVKALLFRARTSFKSAWTRPEDVFRHEFLAMLGDSGVLQTFFALAPEAQEDSRSLIESTTNGDLRRHRTEAVVAALKEPQEVAAATRHSPVDTDASRRAAGTVKTRRRRRRGI